jgi:hypothetical protein
MPYLLEQPFSNVATFHGRNYCAINTNATHNSKELQSSISKEKKVHTLAKDTNGHYLPSNITYVVFQTPSTSPQNSSKLT